MQAGCRATWLIIAAAWLLGLGALARPASGADVTAELSSSEVYVDIPFTLTVTIRNATRHELPRVPAVRGLVIGTPRQVASTGFQVIINGQEMRNDQGIRLAYPVTATSPGIYTIGPIIVVADGQTMTTKPVTFTARRADADDLLLVEVIPEKETVYLGEAAELTLRVWIKPYDDAEFKTRLSSNDMWSLLDVGRSEWGDFDETIRALISDQFGRPRPLTGRDTTRPDGTGQEQSYYLYELAVSLWPQQAGPLPVGTVAAIMRYPVRLERSRRLLTRGQLQLADSRLIAASAAAPVVTVRPPPMDGRPEVFTGAVGRFDVSA
ncbi:MAG: BatD family protein, partial [Planctomycetota bacterium]